MRNQTKTSSSLNLIAGIWLIVAPFVLGYVGTTAQTNDIVLGIVVGAIALIRLFRVYRAAWLNWVNILAGLWLIIAPFVLAYTTIAPMWNDIILGVIVVVLSGWAWGTRPTTGERHAAA